MSAAQSHLSGHEEFIFSSLAEDDQSLSPPSKSNGILHVIQSSGTWEKVPAPDSCFKIVLGDLSVSKLDSKILKSEQILRLRIKGFNLV